MWRLLALLPILFMSCTASEKKSVVVEDLNLITQGPLFEGVNTATLNLNWTGFDLEEQKSYTVKSAKIQKIVLKPQVNISVNSYTILVTSKHSEMQKIGYFTGELAADGTEIILAEDQQKLTKIFQEEDITFVIDFDLTEDYFEDWHILMDMLLEINYTTP